MTLLPVAAGPVAEPLFWRLMEDSVYLSPSIHHDTSTSHSDVQIYAVNFGIKHLLFDHYLRRDLVWLVDFLTV